MSKPVTIGADVAVVQSPPSTKGCEAPHLDAAGASSRRRALLDFSTVEVLAETFRVLGDPTRVRILDALSDGELCVCDIASLVAMSESAVSHQLRLLRTMRLVRHRRSGRQVFYSVDDSHILELLRLAGTHVQEKPSADSFQPSASPGTERDRAGN
jgi:ArsR family transcriptional regulator, lead/cadmium/zinc/bismuth-responsive transcriptional repressor